VLDKTDTEEAITSSIKKHVATHELMSNDTLMTELKTKTELAHQSVPMIPKVQ
jgi:hypothetical protein